MEFSSRLIEDAVQALSKLPGVGQKTALRYVLHLLKQEESITEELSHALSDMRQKVKYCEQCHYISEEALCEICANTSRKKDKICVVESIRDVLAIENTGEFYGQFHVLGGLIAPLKGKGPEDIRLHGLLQRIEENDVREVIFVLSPTIEGDTTAYYISQKLPRDVKVSTIARGIAFGGELEYADELTLARSIANRLPFDKYVKED